MSWSNRLHSPDLGFAPTFSPSTSLTSLSTLLQCVFTFFQNTKALSYTWRGRLVRSDMSMISNFNFESSIGVKVGLYIAVWTLLISKDSWYSELRDKCRWTWYKDHQLYSEVGLCWHWAAFIGRTETEIWKNRCIEESLVSISWKCVHL